MMTPSRYSILSWIVLGVVILLNSNLSAIQTEKTKSNPGTESPKQGAELRQFEASKPAMGVLFRIVLFAKDKDQARVAFTAAFTRIDQINRKLSDYDPDSELSLLSKKSPFDQYVDVSKDLYKVLSRAEELSKLTDGCFDVTIGPVAKLWKDAIKAKQLPDDEKLKSATKQVDFRMIKLDRREPKLRLAGKVGMDLGAIAKGFAADEALKIISKLGVKSALVDASGDIAIGDPPPSKKGWRVSIQNALPKPGAALVLLVSNCGVATSGDAFQFVQIGETRYSHIVNPKTGIGHTPSTTVCVVCEDAMTADALASGVTILGPEKGMDLLERRENTSGLIGFAREKGASKWSLKISTGLPLLKGLKQYAPKPNDKK